MKSLQPRIYYNTIYLLFLGIIIIWCSASALYTIPPFAEYSQYALLFVGLSFIPSVFYFYFNNAFNTLMLSFLMLVFMLVITAITHFGDAFGNYIYLLSAITVAFGITITYSFEAFVNAFLKLMVIISAISILFYVLLQNTSILNSLPKYMNINDVQYGIGFVWNYIISSPDRNCGLFWEPGVFASFLIFAIVFEVLFKKGKMSYARLVLFSVCIFTANSSAGFLLLFICTILLFVSKNKDKDIKIFRIILFTAVMIISVIILINIDKIILNTSLADNSYFVKLLSDNIASSSRVLSVSYYFNIFIENPVFGAGFDNIFEQARYSSTSTSTYFISVFGIFGLSYSLFFIYGILKLTSKNIFAKTCALIIIFAILNKEPHANNLFTWCFLFYLLKQSDGNIVRRNRELVTDNI